MVDDLCDLSLFSGAIDYIHRHTTDVSWVSGARKFLKGFSGVMRLVGCLSDHGDVYVSGSSSILVQIGSIVGYPFEYTPNDFDIILFVDNYEDVSDVFTELSNSRLFSASSKDAFFNGCCIAKFHSSSVPPRVYSLKDRVCYGDSCSLVSLKIFIESETREMLEAAHDTEHLTASVLRSEPVRKINDVFYGPSVRFSYKYTQSTLEDGCVLWWWNVPTRVMGKPVLSDFLSFLSVAVPAFGKYTAPILRVKSLYSDLFSPSLIDEAGCEIFSYFLEKYFGGTQKWVTS